MCPRAVALLEYINTFESFRHLRKVSGAYHAGLQRSWVVDSSFELHERIRNVHAESANVL
jgi:hypothetical protein